MRVRAVVDDLIVDPLHNELVFRLLLEQPDHLAWYLFQVLDLVEFIVTIALGFLLTSRDQGGGDDIAYQVAVEAVNTTELVDEQIDDVISGVVGFELVDEVLKDGLHRLRAQVLVSNDQVDT